MQLAYFTNRMSRSKLKGKTPFQSLYQKEPKYSHLRVFGCLCFATINQTKTKFEDNVKGVFVRYSHQRKGYEIFNLKTKEIFNSWDVNFVETVLTFLDYNEPKVTQENWCDNVISPETDEQEDTKENPEPKTPKPKRPNNPPKRYRE